MGGVDTVRGISYQHAHSVLTALDVVADEHADAVMVEGTEDVMDIAVLDHRGMVMRAKQIKTRAKAYTWGKSELLEVLRRWAKLDLSTAAEFEFITDGRLGPTGLQVQGALKLAADGSLAPAAELLEVGTSDEACAVMTRCVIRQDELGVEPVLAEAEREVRTLLPGISGDATLLAQQAVDRLFVVISVRAGMPDPAMRVIRKREILDIIGGTSGVAREDRWDIPLRGEYMDAVAALGGEVSVVPKLFALGLTEMIKQADEDEGGDATVEIETLAAAAQYATVAGPTGSGKSTMTRLLRTHGVGEGILIVLTHAEAYVAGRFDSLVADGLSGLVGRDLPTITGRQALADKTVTIIVDGVSEIPVAAREALAGELRPLSAAGKGARLVLVGRDSAALGSVFSMEATVARYTVAAFDHEQRRTLARKVLSDDTTMKGKPPLRADAAAAQAEYALGDAAGNPMLLTMSLRLFAAGVDFTDRSGLYSRFIEQMAGRTGVIGISEATAALAVTYAGLLNEGRRYASSYEWQRRVADGCSALHAVGVEVNRAAVLEAADRSGLVTYIGHTQVRVPAHDSFADYLAGWAHAKRLAPLPAPLLTSDEQRVLFTGEIGGITETLVRAAATDLPLVIPRLSAQDTRLCDEDTPTAVMELLRILSPSSFDQGVRMWRARNRIIVSLVPGGLSGWVDEGEGRNLLREWPSAIVEAPNGPLAVAARLWALYVTAQLKVTEAPSLQPSAATPEEAAAAVASHAEATEAAINAQLEQCFSSAAAAILRTNLGPLGLEAVVYNDHRFDDHPFARLRGEGNYTVVFQHATETKVWGASDEERTRLNEKGFSAYFNGYGGQTNVASLLRDSPQSSARKRIREAANRAAGVDWL